MPEVAAVHLLEIFLEIGPVLAGGMGPVPITFSEIVAWQSCSGVALAPWECRAMRTLSFAYLAELRRAEDPMSQAPWSEAPTTDEMGGVAKSLRATLKGMAS